MLDYRNECSHQNIFSVESGNGALDGHWTSNEVIWAILVYAKDELLI